MPNKKGDENADDSKLTTGVDNLLDLLKKQEKISLEEAAEQLGVSLNVVQSWVDFLVEEQIVGIEYKFTKPFIYLNQTEVKEEVKEETSSFDTLKEDFMKKAEQNNIPQQNLTFLWKNHVGKALEDRKDFFFSEATKKGLKNKEKLWEAYKQRLTTNGLK